MRDQKAYVAAMWLLFLRAPGRNTAPGEVVDLGEIGATKTKDWERLTPYSPAVRIEKLPSPLARMPLLEER